MLSGQTGLHRLQIAHRSDRWRCAYRRRLFERTQSICTRIGRISLWSRRFGRVGSHVSQRSVYGTDASLSTIGNQSTAINALAAASHEKTWTQRVSVLFPGTCSRINTLPGHRAHIRVGLLFSMTQIPPNAPASVTLQPAAGDTGKPCGVDYELKTFVADSLEDKTHKRNSVRLAIRKLTYAQQNSSNPQPMIEAHKEFMMSSAPLHMECTLDKEVSLQGSTLLTPFCSERYRYNRKYQIQNMEENYSKPEKHIDIFPHIDISRLISYRCLTRPFCSKFKMYYHGESINVNVQITNNSNKTVKKIKLSGKWESIEKIHGLRQTFFFNLTKKNKTLKLYNQLK
jgi:hypothetical protein